jgi:DNA-directed RNA polymerase II subunit RPB2
MLISEIRSSVEGSTRPAQPLAVKLIRRQKDEGPTIRVQIPHIRADVPVIIVFRALGFVADREVLDHIIYDVRDKELMDALRQSLEEAFEIQDQEVALDYIGKRGAEPGVGKEKRIRYAREILQKHMLPHVGITAHREKKKAYFLGYMVHRLLLVHLGRREEDDRDHYMNKRLDLAGPLLAALFRQSFRQLTKEAKKYLQKQIDAGREFTLHHAIKHDTITRSLKYAAFRPYVAVVLL